MSPVSDAHFEQARQNRAFAEQMLTDYGNSPTHVQWAVTAAYYSALHCRQGYLLIRGRDPQSHVARGHEIADPANQVPMDVQRAYIRLEQFSKKARYRLGIFAPSFVRSRIFDDTLKRVTDFVGL
ncbi:MAG TPA: hypothetical protein VFH48_40620 [Chloroflexota bacterium]|nr:hypothetical protein [Chloroflexota bacterium]